MLAQQVQHACWGLQADMCPQLLLHVCNLAISAEPCLRRQQPGHYIMSCLHLQSSWGCPLASGHGFSRLKHGRRRIKCRPALQC